MRAVTFDTIVAAIRKEGASWCDEPLLDRFERLPRIRGTSTLATKKLPLYLGTLALTLSEVMPEAVARTLAGSLTLLRVIGDLDHELRECFAGTSVRQSTEFELTTLYGGLLAARMLWIESLREIVFGGRSRPVELRAAAVEEATADVVRRYSATARGLLLQESISPPRSAVNLDSTLDIVSTFLRAGGGSFVARTDRICEGLGIAASEHLVVAR